MKNNLYMRRKLFCEISPWTFRLSVEKCILARKLSDKLKMVRFAQTKSSAPLPVVVYRHNSLIRRKLGNTDLALQENKAVNLSLAAPRVNNIFHSHPGHASYHFCHRNKIGRAHV